MSAALTCRIAPMHRRFSLSALPDADLWRIVDSQVPNGAVDGSATLRSEKVQGQAQAIDRMLERVLEAGNADAERLRHTLGQAFLVWTFGRPGIRPRATAARDRLHQAADLFLATVSDYARSVREARAFAQERGLGALERATQPGWLEEAEADARAGTPLHERREALVRSLSSSLARSS